MHSSGSPNESDRTVSKIGATGKLAVPLLSAPYAIAFDGTNIWVANVVASSVTKLLASTGAVVALP